MKRSLFRDNLRGIYYIILKDMKSYYFKPPAISWGIVFPIAWMFAFYLRNPQNFSELVPGLIAMTMLFSTSAAAATVINWEIRYGSFERLLLAPVSLSAILVGKILGGALFGFMMTFIITVGSLLLFNLEPNIFYLLLLIIPSLLAFAALSALLCAAVKEVMDAQIWMNLPRFAMVFLSGVVYPVAKMPQSLQYIAATLPLTYTINGLREAFAGSSEHLLLNFLILTAFFIIFLLPGVRLLAKKFE